MRAERTIPRWFWVAAGLFVAAAAAFGLWLFLPPSRAEYDRVIAQLKSEGYALHPSQALGPAAPGAEDAARDFDAAYDELIAAHGDPNTWTVTGPWDAKVVHPWPETASAEQLAALAV